MIGIFFLNDTVRINPFNSYTLLCIAFFVLYYCIKNSRPSGKDSRLKNYVCTFCNTYFGCFI